MLLTQEENAADYVVHQVTSTAVTVNHQCYTQSFLLMPRQFIFPWRPRTLEELQPQDFAVLLATPPELIVLGVGAQGGKLSPELYVYLLQNQLVIECMSLPAAARTYTILSAENRAVVAAMIM